MASIAQGRLWLAGYASASNPVATGLWILQIDPATGLAIGSGTHAPQSAALLNNVAHFGFACAAICRLVYAQTVANGDASGNVLSWAPDEAAPIVVESVGKTNIKAQLAAAFDLSGRLWVAWYTNAGTGSYQAKRGDSRGAGGIVQGLGTPPNKPKSLDEPSVEITAVAYKTELVVAALWSHNASWDLYASTVPTPVDTTRIPNPGQIQDPAGSDVVPGTVTTVGQKRCVLARVQAYKPATLSVAPVAPERVAP